MDNRLYDRCLKIRSAVTGKDNDAVFVIDGRERSGKSVFAQQIAKAVDPTFNINRMCLTPEQFKEAVVKAKKGEAIVFDEAFTGFSSMNALGSINKLLKELMMEMGQKNLVVFIVLPTIFTLEKYVAIFRSKGLFHIYTKSNNGKSQRGRWMFFPPRKVKLLYLYGKKDMSYSQSTHHKIPKSNFRGRFYDQYTLVEKSYREKKAASLTEKGKNLKEEGFKEQRDRLLKVIYERWVNSVNKLSLLCDEAGFKLSKTQINDVINKLKQEEEIKQKSETLKREESIGPLGT